MLKHIQPIMNVALAVAGTLVISGAADADSIVLKNAIRLVGDVRTITLADVAEIEGPEAARFATLKIAQVTDPAAVTEICIKDVRSALEQAGVNWGAVNLSGRKVIVRPSRDGSAAAPMAMAGASLAGAKTPAPTVTAPPQPASADTLVGQEHLRGQIVARIAAGLRVDPRNLRLTFDDADAAFLDGNLNGTHVELDPQSSFNSDRIALTVRLWNDDRVQSQRTVSVQPLVLMKAATVAKDIDKDQIIAEDDLTTTEQWLAPSQVSMTVSFTQAVGRAAAKKLNAGEILRDKSIRHEALIKKGEQATVRCLVGGVAISMQAEARADGSEGDTIEFRKQGERETFRATVTGRAEAVLDLRQKDATRPATT